MRGAILLDTYARYCTKTGQLFRVSTGKNLGSQRGNGYLSFRYQGKQYHNHRVAWYLTHGTWPDKIDHVDGNPLNNRLSNLRNTTSRGNSSNLPRHRAGKLVGATYYPKRRQWLARIYVDKRSVFLGWHSTEAEAHAAYVEYRGSL